MEVLEIVNAEFDRNPPAWTHERPLPGGNFGIDGFEDELTKLREAYAFLDSKTAYRFIRCYGTNAFRILDSASQKEDLGKDFGAGLSECEVDYLQRSEWAETAEDILWRRSKLGLRLSHGERCQLEGWLSANPVSMSSNTA